MSFSVATLKAGDRLTAALVVSGRVWPVKAVAEATGLAVMEGTLFDYLQQWDVALPQLERLADKINAGIVPARLSSALSEASLAAPISLPRKVFASGANYQSHIDEMIDIYAKEAGLPPPPPEKRPKVDPTKTPFFFMKPGSTAVVGPGNTVHMPPKCTNLDWEGELVVVFGKRGRGIQPKAAMEHVAGYTLAIDFTARNQMEIPEHVFRWDFILGKCQDTMTPVGPVFVPKQFVDAGNFAYTLSVNGKQKQDANSRDMLYPLANLIAGVSEGVTIEPGDLLLTGSPAGAGKATGERLAVGDRVVVDSPITGPMEVVIQTPL